MSRPIPAPTRPRVGRSPACSICRSTDGARGASSADDFDGLLVEDKERDLLRWIADPDAARAAKDAGAWSAFRDQVEAGLWN